MVIGATREVGAAITSSTLATVAVFLPMGLLSGGLQDFLMPFALTVSYSLLASLLVAITVVPVMSAWLLKSTKFKEHKPSEKFKRLLTWKVEGKETNVFIDKIIDPESKDALSAIEITTKTGIVPLSSIAKIEEREQYSSILHKEGETYIRVSAKVDPTKLSIINKEIQMKIHEIL
jgi:multidrug efflux pump subunit AcrB